MQNLGDIIKQRPELLGNFDELAKNTLENKYVKNFLAEHKPTNDVINRSISKMYEFVKEREKFDNKDSGISDGYMPVLVMNSGYIDVSYQTTAELAKKQKARDTYAMLKRDSILSDESVKNATFETFKIDESNREEAQKEREAYQFALNLAERYISGEVFTTFFVGDVGTGKSHLAMSILDYVNKKSWVTNNPKKVMFVSISELMDKIKDSFNDKTSHYTEERMLDLMKSADLLVIDDLGRESNLTSEKAASDWTQKFIFKLFEKPSAKIITTNLDKQGLKNIYNAGNASRILRNSNGNRFIFTGISDKRERGY